MEQWLARTERTFAPIRLDIKRCVLAGIIRSISETRYHDGFSSQAGWNFIVENPRGDRFLHDGQDPGLDGIDI